MTIEDALKEIKSEPKWYYRIRDGKLIPVATLVVTAQRIQDGRAKPSTVKKFFEEFGYKVEINQTVKKIT